MLAFIAAGTSPAATYRASDPAFEAQIRAFSGKTSVTTFRRGKLGEQVIEAVSVPGDQKSLADGKVLVTGNRPQDGSVTGAVVVLPDGHVAGQAIRYTMCSPKCAATPSLLIAKRKGEGSNDVVGVLTQWASAQGTTGQPKILTVTQ